MKAILKVSPELIVDFLKIFKSQEKFSYQIVENPLPEDAEIIDIVYNGRVFNLILESKEFKEDNQILAVPVIERSVIEFKKGE